MGNGPVIGYRLPVARRSGHTKKSTKNPFTSDHLDLRPVLPMAEHVLDAGYAQLAEVFDSEAHRAETPSDT